MTELSELVNHMTARADQVLAQVPKSETNWPDIKLMMQQACAQFFLLIKACVNPKLPIQTPIPAQVLLRALIEYSIVLQYMLLDPETRVTMLVKHGFEKAKRSH